LRKAARTKSGPPISKNQRREALGETSMTLCPIAIVAGCEKCPAFKICPLKGVIGNAPKAEPPTASRKASGKPRK